MVVVTSRKPQQATQPLRPPNQPKPQKLHEPLLRKALARHRPPRHSAPTLQNVEKLPPDAGLPLLPFLCPTKFHFVLNQCSPLWCVSHSTSPAGSTKKSTTVTASSLTKKTRAFVSIPVMLSTAPIAFSTLPQPWALFAPPRFCSTAKFRSSIA